jgi:cation diffusion facilitator CzcD-associated flavoprotein CzcO
MKNSGKAQRTPRVAIIGAGMSGMLMAIKLLNAGIKDFHIYDKAAEIGGTWRVNTYPGIACDVASHYYTYSFEPNPGWSSRLPQGGEIQAYLLGVAGKYQLRQYITFNKEVVDGQHDGRRWLLSMHDGEQLEADVVVACCGLLHHPKLPVIKGMEQFAGASFHSACWNHDVPLDGRRVGVIGNGSTGVQIIAALAVRPLRLTVFQRTPQWIFPLPNRAYSGFERRLLRWFPGLAKLIYFFYRTAFEHTFARAVIQPGWQRRLLSWLCHWNLNRVKDPELRRKLTPDYTPLCKRMVMSVDFLPAMQRDNVELVAEDIDHIEAAGVVTRDGRLHAVDALVYATGFDAHAYFRPLQLTNAAGVKLATVWEQGPLAHRTVSVPGFANFFMTLGPQSPIGNFSAISIAETQIDYIMQCIGLIQIGTAKTLAPTAAATQAFNERVRNAMAGTIWVSGCTSWYIGKNGVPSAWPFSGARFRQELKTLRLDEFEVSI